MRRVLLIFFLLGAQLISWNAAPLFLCLDGDGALCIDLGPRACSCCRHHHADHAVDGCCDETHERLSGQPCDCTHLQITVAWTAVTVSPEGSRSIVLATPTALLSDADNMLAALSRSAGNDILSPSRALIARGSSRSILRC